jgi:ribA/ribD-fused uncharacterized protein
MGTTKKLRRYERHEAVTFSKTNEEFGGLSNMAPGFSLEINGVEIRTCEALYQACRFPHMPDVQGLIINQKSPMTAKMKSKPYRSLSRSDWDTVRVRIMRWCLRVKIACNYPKFYDLLLATGNRPIVEESKRDEFWGAKACNDGTLAGANVLGRLLMELRQDLCVVSSQSFRRVEPLAIKDFLLFGEPILVVDPRDVQVQGGGDLFARSCDKGSRRRSQSWVLATPPAGLTEGAGRIALAQGSRSTSTGEVSNMTYPRRLIEVDLPIKEISAHARREKSIRHAHISTLHIWWARRPLAACRAVILAALWPDPADMLCPEQFRAEAAQAMKEFRNRCGGRQRNWDDPADVRAALLDFIADFANWDNTVNPAYFETARRLVQVAHESLGGVPGTRPLLVDPFAGGGAIPLEALRVGADAFASDLNPVAVLLNKVVLEYIPKYGQELADEIEKWGRWVKEQAEKELAPFYPSDVDGSVPIAYLWARTIRCQGPGCGATVPLMRSLWLAKKSRGSVALRMVPKHRQKRVEFEIIEDVIGRDVGEGTVRRGSATCPFCGYTTPVASVRQQLRSRKGGAHDAQMIAVRQNDLRTATRSYRLPTSADIDAAQSAMRELEFRRAKHPGGLALVPDEPLPPQGTLGFRVQLYGMLEWGHLFTPRQLLSLTTIVKWVREAGERLSSDHSKEFGEAVQTCLAMAIDRLADFNTSLCVLNVVGGRGVVHTFGRQALPIVWDFMETNPFNEVGANWTAGIDAFCDTIAFESANRSVGHAHLLSATQHPLPDDSCAAFVTDPPYYDAVPYSDLSDFFYVWLRRSLPSSLTTTYGDSLTPKDDECIVDEVKGKDKLYFETMMGRAMAEGRRIVNPEGIGIVVFAHKSTAGWEAQLQAMVDAGWIMTGSWPIDTERPGRLRAQNSAALASSIHLVCRPREAADGSLQADAVGDWSAVLRELPARMHEWMPRLAREGVVGADAIFACLGPALEIFSRYSRVEKASGERVDLREYLQQVWAAVAREALSMIFEDADATGLEEDARLTAIWLWTLSTSTNGNGKSESEIAEDGEGNIEEEEAPAKAKSSGGFSIEFDAARKIAQGLGAHLEDLGRVVEIRGDQARLLSVAERTRHLFGKDQAQLGTARRPKKAKQLTLFEEFLAAAKDVDWADVNPPSAGETTLDRVHQAMILFATGRGEALKRFLIEEGVGQDSKFWKLAQSLSALYPPGTDDKRWIDGVLARKKGLGF